MTPPGAVPLAGLTGALVVLVTALPGRPARLQPLTGRGPRAHPAAPHTSRPRRVWRRSMGLALASVVAFLLAPPLAVIPPAAAWARARARALRSQRRDRRRIADSLPDAVDLLALCTSGGWTLPVAHLQVARRLPAPLGAALGAAAASAEAGQPRAEALLEALDPFGDRARALGQVLADHLRYGVALAPSLERLGLELRLDRRRRAELEARRVPVRLLGPLVLCVLPAFALLTVVPLLVASLQALPT